MENLEKVFFGLTPMLLTQSAPFDSDDCIFEIKFDGIRCLCLIDNSNIILKSRNGRDITSRVPELNEIYKCAEKPCILDGELVVLKDGKPDLYSLLKRSERSKKDTASLGYTIYTKREIPAEYAVFDMLFLDGEDIRNLPLTERKALLKENIREGNNLSLVRHIQGQGINFFNLIKEHGLEGIVAKQKNSPYICGKRGTDWLKIKATTEEDFFVLGFICAESQPAELILGKFEDGILSPIGELNITAYKNAQKTVKEFAQNHVATAQHSENFRIEKYFENVKNAVRLAPGLICKTEYLNKTESGRLRQPVFRGLTIK